MDLLLMKNNQQLLARSAVSRGCLVVVTMWRIREKGEWLGGEPFTFIKFMFLTSCYQILSSCMK